MTDRVEKTWVLCRAGKCDQCMAAVEEIYCERYRGLLDLVVSCYQAKEGDRVAERGNEKMEIRTCTTDDLPGIVNVQNSIYPDKPRTVEDYVESEERRDPKCKFERWVAVVAGCIVGVGVYQQNLWAYHPQKFGLDGGVLPEYQGQGIGSALYDKVIEGLEPFDPIELRASVRGDYPQGVHFFQKRGFSEHMRDRESRLDVMAFDPSPYQGLEDRLRAQNIEVRTCCELESDPERDRKLYDLEWELLQDVPGSDEFTRVPFEKWREDIVEAPMFLPDAYFVAVDGKEYVGMSDLRADRATDALNTGLTGVKRSHRCRGIATALKVRGILYAQDNGNPIIRTDNEQNNRPMLSINERLGFVRQPDWITLKKVLRAE